ncbi:MAG: HupE/UreJ family protein [Deltaproteobacteria bacterium]|nr:HupE/UreJ family protein [Deltaproteobacteria bacterium]MDQ3296955.1 HupE/UreJ family protein [Myxococcota bacterium]
MRWALAMAVVAALVVPAAAHQSSIKYVDITVDGAAARVALTVAPPDVNEGIGLAADAQPTVGEVLAAAVAARTAAYVRGWLALTAAGQPCVAGEARARPDPDGKFVVVEWTATCAAAIEVLRVDLGRFFALDQRHEAIVTMHAPGKHGEPSIARVATPVLELRAGAEASFVAWIGYGMDHIYGGLDHVCFVLALLLVVVLVRTPEGWQVRSLWPTLRATAAIITGFTLAHSVSLIAASLGWIALPSRLVESLIAASIVYTAIENTVVPDVRWRFAMTVGFGLIHGLGFASMLAELLPAEDVLLPLIGFNVGVEVGQLTIVVVALPVFAGIARWLGASRYRRTALVVAAVPLVLIGLKWLVERVFDLPPLFGM